MTQLANINTKNVTITFSASSASQSVNASGPGTARVIVLNATDKTVYVRSAATAALAVAVATDMPIASGVEQTFSKQVTDMFFAALADATATGKVYFMQTDAE